MLLALVSDDLCVFLDFILIDDLDLFVFLKKLLLNFFGLYLS